MKIDWSKFGKAVNNQTIWVAMVLSGAITFGLVMAGFISWRIGGHALSLTIPELVTTNSPHSTHLQNMGNLGSYLQGTTASQWALAGVFLIFVAFLAQMLQLRLQQAQFERQSFETSFFQLLTLHGQLVSDIRDTLDGGSDAEGRQMFPLLHKRMKNLYEDAIETKEDTEQLAVKCYEALFEKHPEILGHYFRHLYHIIKFIADSKTEPPDKKRYASIVRAQLSVYEHALLHYNGLSEYGEDKFKELIERFALLENMKRELLLNVKHETVYKKEAFGEDSQLYRFKSQT